jgi:SAM-dependent methyltransferase
MVLKCASCDAVGLEERAEAWVCAACGHAYPIVGGVPRFVPADAYAESFGFQWTRFARTQLDSANGTTRSRDTFVEKTGWSLAELAGTCVLDVGCGMGRFAEIAADAGAEVYGIDLSRAVEAAHDNLGSRPNVHLFQADVMHLPFVPESFDFIYSIGVLHHTPDTRAAFRRLPALLKPGGRITIWVYSTEVKLRGSEWLRTVTPSIPQRWLLAACRVAIPLYHVHRLPGIGRVTCVAMPTSLNEDPEWRWLDTFDWYAPTYQWKHTFEEVEAWFADAGLDGIRRLEFPVAVTATRPTRP